jgi:hypothetical protein
MQNPPKPNICVCKERLWHFCVLYYGARFPIFLHAVSHNVVSRSILETFRLEHNKNCYEPVPDTNKCSELYNNKIN